IAAWFLAACWIKRRTVSVGCAPFPIQYCTRSDLRLISAGSRVGLYVPRFSRYAPSRFDCFSLTTMRYDGRFFAPVRINLIANKLLPPDPFVPTAFRKRLTWGISLSSSLLLFLLLA